MNDVSDTHGGRGGHVADDQGAVDYAAADRGFLPHILIVDVLGAEIAGDAREQRDVGFPDRLHEAVMLTDLHHAQS
jgi:hypothetical protein